MNFELHLRLQMKEKYKVCKDVYELNRLNLIRNVEHVDRFSKNHDFVISYLENRVITKNTPRNLSTSTNK